MFLRALQRPDTGLRGRLRIPVRRRDRVPAAAFADFSGVRNLNPQGKQRFAEQYIDGNE